jgi:thiamine-monophosphate kinase
MHSVRALGEVGLIARLAHCLPRGSSVLVGIGDDAAVLRLSDGRLLLLASDMLVEGTHFLRNQVQAPWIGWKALACNVSDIAAMGGRPLWAVVSLGLPPTTSVRFVDGLYAGLSRCARRFGLAVVGGDTVRAPQVIVDVAVVGTVRPEQLTLRSGARVGDVLFVTGRLGGSYVSGRHARFLPRLREAQELAQRVRIHAMIDVSDGLASDLWQVSRASRVVLRVQASKIPISGAGRTCLRRACPCRSPRWRGRQALRHALMDGEDFELLFAVSPQDAHRVPRRLGACPVTRIGTAVSRGVRVELESSHGQVQPLIPTGFRHF